MEKSKNKVAYILGAAFGMFVMVLLSLTVVLNIFADVEGIFYGLALMCIAIPFHINGKKRNWCYCISFILNSVAIGLEISAYYLTEKIAVDVIQLAPPAILAFSVILFASLFLYILPKSKRIILITGLIIIIVLGVMAIFNWINTETVFYSCLFFFLVISLVWLGVFRMTIGNRRNIFRDISFGGFGVLILVAVTVITLITEDDSALPLEIAAETIDGASSNKKRGKL